MNSWPLLVMCIVTYIGYIKADVLPFYVSDDMLPDKTRYVSKKNIHEKNDYYHQMELAEKHYNLPKNILRAICMVESSNHPWSIRFNQKVYRFKTQSEAEHFLHALEVQHHKHNIDIGLMQINNQHCKYFKNLRHMLNPVKNIWFAARLLALNVVHAKSMLKGIMIYNTGYAHNHLIGLHMHKYVRHVVFHWKNFSGEYDLEKYSYIVRKIKSIHDDMLMSEDFLFVREMDKMEYKDDCAIYTDTKQVSKMHQALPFLV